MSGEIFTTNQQTIIDTHYVTTARKFIAKGTRNSDSGDLARTGDNAKAETSMAEAVMQELSDDRHA